MKSLNDNKELWMEIDIEEMEEREELGCLFGFNCFCFFTSCFDL